MENHILEKKTMEAVKALSDLTLKISEQQNLLCKLQEEETEYLIEREKKAMERIKLLEHGH